MVDYKFYVNYYLGGAIPEKAFSGVAAQAQAYLDRLRRCCRVESSGAEAENMALCAMAETLWARRNDGLTSACVGSVTVHYADRKPSITRELYEKAAIYLDIYRGVKG